MKIALAASLAVLAALALAPAAGARSRSCTRGHAKLEYAAGNLAVVRVSRRPERPQTRDDELLACWRPTGRRTLVVEEQDLGDDLSTSSDVEIVDQRYVGALTEAAGGVTVNDSAVMVDAKRGRLLHEADGCVEGAVLSGPADAAFLPAGGLAWTCDDGSLHMYRTGATKTSTQPDASTGIGRLAVVRHSRSFGASLYWTRADGTSGSLAL